VLLVADSFGAVLLKLIALEDLIAFKEFLEGAFAKENHLSVFGIPTITIAKKLPGEDAALFEGGTDTVPSKRKLFGPKKGENKLSADKIKLTFRKVVVLYGDVLKLEILGRELLSAS